MAELHRGRLAKAPRILSVRPLTRDDLGCLHDKRVQPRVKSLSMAHHRLARLVAFGYRNEEVCRITGFSLTRLSTLKLDPAFQQLVATYADKVTEAHIAELDEMAELSTSNMIRAERQIEQHLDEADETGELVPIKTLLAITSDRADRFGYPKRKEINSNVTIDFAKRIEKAMTMLGRGSVIDAKPLSLPTASASISPASTTPEPQPSRIARRF